MIDIPLLKPKGKDNPAIKIQKDLKVPEEITTKDVSFVFCQYSDINIFDVREENTILTFITENRLHYRLYQ